MLHNSRFQDHLSNQDHLCQIPIIDHQISNQTTDQFNDQTNNQIKGQSNVQIRAQINNRTRDQFNARINIRIKDHNNHSVLEMVNIMKAANMVEVNQWVVKADSLIIQRVITIIKISDPNPLTLMTNSFQPLPIHFLHRSLVSMI